MPTLNWEVLQGKETETNWQKRDELLSTLSECIDTNSWTSGYTIFLKQYFFNILSILQSGRTQLALNSCKFIGKVFEYFEFEVLESVFDSTLNSLVRLCSSTKRIIASAGEESLRKLLLQSPSNKVILLLQQTIQDKNSGLRQRIVESFFWLVQRRMDRWIPKYWVELEPIILKLIFDPNPIVRGRVGELISMVSDKIDVQRLFAVSDTATIRQLRALLQKKPSNIPQPEIINNQEVLTEIVSHDQLQDEDDSTDDEVTIPMRRISLYDQRCKTPSPTKPIPSKIPIRSFSELKFAAPAGSPPELKFATPAGSPSELKLATPTGPSSELKFTAPVGSSSELKFATPFRLQLRHDGIPSSPSSPTTFSLDNLFKSLHEDPVPTATWKKLYLLAKSNSPLLDSVRINSLFAVLGSKVKELPADDLGTVGLLIRSLFTVADGLIQFNEPVISVVISCHLKYFDFALFWDEIPPGKWFSLDRDRVNEFLNFCTRSTIVDSNEQVAVLELLQQIFIDLENDTEVLAECLPSLHQIWNNTKTMNVKKSVVSCISIIRKRIGDAIFFQILPTLTLSQRRLLDAYISFGIN